MNKNTDFTSDKKSNLYNGDSCAHVPEYIKESNLKWAKRVFEILPPSTMLSANTHETCSYYNDDEDDTLGACGGVDCEDDLENNAADNSTGFTKSCYSDFTKCVDARSSRNDKFTSNTDIINEKANILQNPSKKTYLRIDFGVENLSIVGSNAKSPSCVECRHVCDIGQKKMYDIEDMGNKSIFCDNTFKGPSTNMSAVSIESQEKLFLCDGGYSQYNCTP